MIKGNSGCHGNREAQHKMRVTGGVSGVFLTSAIWHSGQLETPSIYTSFLFMKSDALKDSGHDINK